MKKLLPILLILLLVLYFAYDRYMDRKVGEEVDKTLSSLNLKGSYEEVDYSPLSGEVRIRNLSLLNDEGEESLRVSELVVREFSDRTVDISYRGLKLEDEEKLPQELRKDKYRENLIDGEILLHIQKQEGVLELKKLSLVVRDGFELKLGLRLSNVDMDFWQSLSKQEEVNPFLLMNQIGDTRFSYASLSFIDMGAKEKVLQEEAYNRGMKPEEYKRHIIKEIERDIESSDDELERIVLEKLKEFIQKGKELHITAKPEREISVGKILTTFAFTREDLLLRRMVKLLNIEIEVR